MFRALEYWRMLERVVRHPYLELDACSSTVVCLVLWAIINKIQLNEWVRRFASGCSLAVFIVVLTALLLPAPEIDFFVVVHALIRSGLLAAVALIVLVLILPIIAGVWQHTVVRFYRGFSQFINDVEYWIERRGARVAAKKSQRKREKELREHMRQRASEPPPPPPPTQQDEHVEALRRYGANVALIQQSPLDPNEQQTLIEDEKRVLADRLRQIME